MNSIKERIADTLLILQKTEALLRAILLHVSTNDQIYPILQKLFDRDYQTMGMLLQGLKKTIKLPSDFSTTLDHLLQDRNIFVHNLFLQDWFDLKTEKGQEEVHLFLDRILSNGKKTLLILMAYILVQKDEELDNLSMDKQLVFDEILNRLFVTADPDFGEHKNIEKYCEFILTKVNNEYTHRL